MKGFVKTIVSLIAVAAAAGGVLAFRSGGAAGAGFDLGRMALADSVILHAIADGEFPGAVLCVVRRAEDGKSAGDVLYLKAYGNRQVCSGADPVSGEPIGDTIPMTEDAVFDLASLSKCVGTTLAFMRLVEDGKVRLTDDVALYIPDFKPWSDKSGAKRDITIKHLLTHTSGLPAGVHVPTFVSRYEKYGDPAEMNLRDSLVAYIARDAARLSRPSDELRYSCLNFIVLQAIIERVAGERMDRFAEREIFRPLGLADTWYNAVDDAERPYAPDAPIAPTSLVDGKVLRGEVHDPTARIVNKGVSGNAGLFSTAEDLAVIASMLMNGGSVDFPEEGRHVSVLSRRAVETFFRIPTGYERFGRTLGWVGGSSVAGDLFTEGRTVDHTGYTGTSMMMDLDEGVAVILLTNRVHPFDEGSVARTRAVIANIVAASLDR